ncbi:hypothetical protein GCM10009642_38420 [Nocardiopsis metallicus]
MLGHVIDECPAAGADHVHVVSRPDDTIAPGYVTYLRDHGGLPIIFTPEDLIAGYGNAAPSLSLVDLLADVENVPGGVRQRCPAGRPRRR